MGSSFDAAVTLSCSGLPALAQCLFNPATSVTPGNSAVDVVMSISTTAPTGKSLSAVGRRSITALWLLLPGIMMGLAFGRTSSKRRLLAWSSSAAVVSLSLILLACAGASTGGGGGGGCSAVPSVPTGLSASSTTSTGTTLNWTASTAIAGCSVTGYPVYQGSTLIATPTTTTYNVTGLSGGTQYNFTVQARDSYGSSAPSTAISVTTLSSGTPPGTYTITVTGSSSGTPADAGQSTQVALVVH